MPQTPHIHAVLMGDSIFDNRKYVQPDRLDVRDQLIIALPDTANVTLLASDGSMIQDVMGQIEHIPEDATHIVLSIGGNNAIDKITMMEDPVNSIAEALFIMMTVVNEFEEQYQAMLKKLISLKKSIFVCTVYNPNFAEPEIQQFAQTGLMVFNDVIIRQAVKQGVPVIDLRFVCAEQDDYANDIEPSAQGGGKIAKTIAQAIQNTKQKRTHIYT